jgi:hypothetical protein
MVDLYWGYLSISSLEYSDRQLLEFSRSDRLGNQVIMRKALSASRYIYPSVHPILLRQLSDQYTRFNPIHQVFLLQQQHFSS